MLRSAELISHNRLFAVSVRPDTAKDGRRIIHQFQLSDYVEMNQAIRERLLTMLIAAHRHTANGRLPDNPGIGLLPTCKRGRWIKQQAHE